MARVGIIGGGAFGTAMACVLRRAGHDTTLWAREDEVVAAINDGRGNPLFLAGVPLEHGIRATSDLADAVTDREFLLLATPAQHLRGIATRLRPLVLGATVVLCSKGIEQGSCALMPEVIAETMPSATVAVLSGPSFAKEIARGLPCGVALACHDGMIRNRLVRSIRTPTFCVYGNGDVIGTALCGVMKNVIAIASGIAAGRKQGENARATIIALGLAETARLGLAKGARAKTFLGLAGIGDLALTANSLQSRNTSLGVALGEGRKLAEVLAERKEVTEGAHSVAAIVALAQRLGVAMPLSEAIDQVLNHGADLNSTMDHWMARAARPLTLSLARPTRANAGEPE
jgi:glycerol-3-phosphate dehydrogenase (NAD(P)+)